MSTPRKGLVVAVAALGLSSTLHGQDLPPDLFTAGANRLFGYTLGTATGEARPAMPEYRSLPRDFTPFAEVRLRWSQPSGTLYDIQGAARIRNDRACVERLNEVRARFDATHGIALREDSFEASDGDPRLEYFGTRDRITWRLSCEGRMLFVSATDDAYDGGCDPHAPPTAPELPTPPDWAERFPGLEASPAPEIRAVWQRIAMSVESMYAPLRARSPCLEAAIAISAVLDSDGAVQAVATSSSTPTELAQRVTELVRRTAFPKSSDAIWRHTNVVLTLEDR